MLLETREPDLLYLAAADTDSPLNGNVLAGLANGTGTASNVLTELQRSKYAALFQR